MGLLNYKFYWTPPISIPDELADVTYSLESAQIVIDANINLIVEGDSKENFKSTSSEVELKL